jgi:hypothetical protein
MALCQIHLRWQEFVAVKQVLASLNDAQLRESPYFLFFRGVVRFAAVLSRPEQGVALTGLPLDARYVQPILPDQQLETELDGAQRPRTLSMHVPTLSPFMPYLRLLQNPVLSECQSRLPT